MAEDKRQNEIIRVQKKKHNFFICDKGFLDDERLSYKAKGILAYLCSKPDNWRVVVKDLITHARDGRDSIYAGLNELKTFGYYTKTAVRNEKGIVTHWDSVIYEDPTENPRESALLHPLPDFPDTAKPDTENPEHNNIYINNTDLNNIDKQQPAGQNEPAKPKRPLPKKDVVVVGEPIHKPELDVSSLDFIKEPFTDAQKAAILRAYAGNIERIRANYQAGQQQRGIRTLMGWLMWGAENEIEQPMGVKAQNKFVNFQQRDIDFAELERLENEQLKAAVSAGAQGQYED